MKLPSIKTLSAIFPENPKQARAILEMTREDFLTAESCVHFDSVKQMIRASYHPPKVYSMKMHALDIVGRFHGSESIESTKGEYAEYLNTGDTYAPTLIRWRGRYRVQSLGDFVETMERQHIYFK